MSEFFVVATPIGNLSDITFRAVETLKNCDLILCEDSRITNRLLLKYEIKNKKLVIYNDNSDEKIRRKVLEMLLKGLNVALVSDAGTPLISDPGYKLIKFLREHNIKITPISGASSITTALCASGIAVDNFLFLGFLSPSEIQRKNALKELPKNYSFVIFESANRVEKTMENMLEVLGNRKIAIARELTKIHEEIISDSLENMIEFFKNNQEKVRGEFVVIVEKQDKSEKNISDEELESEIEKLLKSGLSIKDVSENLAQVYKMNRKDIYRIALKKATK